jgi:hypothetical protein
MRRNHTLFSVFALLLASACSSGQSELISDSASALLEDETAALPPASEEEAQSAAPGCEGLLVGTESYGIRDELVVAYDEDGNPVCVDSPEAVAQELESTSHVQAASTFRKAYGAAQGQGAAPTSGTRAGDPDPQPNINHMAVANAQYAR